MSDVPYTVTLQAQESGHAVTCPLDGSVPTPSGGGGGWEEVALPKRGAVLVWKGVGLLKLDIPIVFDGTANEVAVSPRYQTLRHMYRPQDRQATPSVLEVSQGGGTGIDAIPYLDEISEWVLLDLAWGDAVGDRRGRRVQQHFVLTLCEYDVDERLRPISAKPKRKRPRHYRILRKDVAGGLGKLAAHFHLKDWRVLALAQSPIRKDPRLTEKDIGKTLIIPVGGNDNLVIVSESPQPITRG